MKFKLIIVSLAECDVQQIFSYISQRSSQGAVAWFTAFEACVQRIASQPFACGLAPEGAVLGVEIRQTIFKTPAGDPYRCVFCVVGNEVRILRVRGRGQPPLSQTELSVG